MGRYFYVAQLMQSACSRAGRGDSPPKTS